MCLKHSAVQQLSLKSQQSLHLNPLWFSSIPYGHNPTQPEEIQFHLESLWPLVAPRHKRILNVCGPGQPFRIRAETLILEHGLSPHFGCGMFGTAPYRFASHTWNFFYCFDHR